MARWLVKTEPETYSFAQLQKDGRTSWDHVRNYTARMHLMAMKVGDEALVYHSVGPKSIVGICKVVREHYPDASAIAEGEPADRWVTVDVAPLRALDHAVSLAQLRASPLLSQMLLVKQSRLSVSPVSDAEWDGVLALASQPAPTAAATATATKKSATAKKKKSVPAKKPAKKPTTTTTKTMKNKKKKKKSATQKQAAA